MIFSIDEELFRLFPSLKVGILVCSIDNMKYGDDRLEEIIDDIKVHFSFERPQDHPNIVAWREAFRRVSLPVSEYQSIVELLLKQALVGGPFPRINPLVDLYRVVSMRHIVPICGHALNMVDGDIRLCFAEGTETFIPVEMGEVEIVDKGEVIYRDSKDALSRRWVWRQSYKDRVENETTKVCIPMDIMEGLPAWLCEAVMSDMEKSIIANGYGTIIHKDIITKDNPKSEFDY
jgi:DNA/RNA-binding domain of Phe-tRNA-synthetase-like protein